ncbi:Elongation factor P [Pararhodospirillum photometricum DSM 122]|uniref:Elongation factor P n=2 Tax=Pararhodospirillum photometricum TaxID=1084 RepID=H6SL88_PARPM|nr:Elongation factor P [Pararhodospirillum photometricum DSM 122]
MRVGGVWGRPRLPSLPFYCLCWPEAPAPRLLRHSAHGGCLVAGTLIGSRPPRRQDHSGRTPTMKMQANQIRPGHVLEHQGKRWTVLKIQLIQPGKGGAFIQVEMRDVDGGNKTNERWRTADTVERLEVRERDCQFLFKDDVGFTFMDTETFEQFVMNPGLIGDQAAFLQESMQVTVDLIEGQPVSVNLPSQVVLTVVEADAVVKGQTASSSYKPGLLENGLKVMIPPFVEAGTKIVVNTTDCTYVERAK